MAIRRGCLSSCDALRGRHAPTQVGSFSFQAKNFAIDLTSLFFYCRKESSFNLGTAETKLLYTLHWVILDAADECSLQVRN